MKKRFVVLAAVLAIACLSGCASSKDEQPKAQEPIPSTTPAAPANSALKIVDLTVGKGDGAKPGDAVVVNYTGWLYENGKRTTKFDSSVGGEPFEMTIGQT